MTKEARLYNGLKTVSPINGVRKTGQTHEKINYSIFYITYKNKPKMD